MPTLDVTPIINAVRIQADSIFEHYRSAMNRRIVCLCGSTRFFEAFQRANYEETMQGKIVLSVGFYPHSQDQAHGEQVGCTAEEKEALDRLHMDKVAMCHEVLVLNVGGYVGESTTREIKHALLLSRTIRWLEPDNKPAWYEEVEIAQRLAAAANESADAVDALAFGMQRREG